MDIGKVMDRLGHEQWCEQTIWHYGAEEQPEAGRYVEAWICSKGGVWFGDLYSPFKPHVGDSVKPDEVWHYSDELHTSPPPDEVRQRLEELGK